MEPDFYKAAVFVRCTASEMDAIVEDNKFGRTMRRAVLYSEAEQRYLAKQKQEKEREARSSLLAMIAEKFPDTLLQIAVEKPKCKIEVSGADATAVINWSDFSFVDIGTLNKKQLVLEIMKKKKIFSVADIQDALAGINVGFDLQDFIRECMDEKIVVSSVDGKYAIRNKHLIAVSKNASD